MITVPKRYVTDGQTDGQTTCNLITALCASIVRYKRPDVRTCSTLTGILCLTLCGRRQLRNFVRAINRFNTNIKYGMEQNSMDITVKTENLINAVQNEPITGTCMEQ